MTLLVVSLVLAQAGNIEVFSDRDETYVRAGAAQGLQVGQSLNVTSKDGKAVGSAVTLEVWDALARVHLDESAQKFHGAKRVLVGKAEPAAEAEAPQTDAPQAAAPAKLKDDDESGDA